MVVKATPSAPLEVIEADLLLELLIIALNAPAQLGEIDEATEREALRLDIPRPSYPRQAP